MNRYERFNPTDEKEVLQEVIQEDADEKQFPPIHEQAPVDLTFDAERQTYKEKKDKMPVRHGLESRIISGTPVGLVEEKAATGFADSVRAAFRRKQEQSHVEPTFTSPETEAPREKSAAETLAEQVEADAQALKDAALQEQQLDELLQTGIKEKLAADSERLNTVRQAGQEADENALFETETPILSRDTTVRPAERPVPPNEEIPTRSRDFLERKKLGLLSRLQFWRPEKKEEKAFHRAENIQNRWQGPIAEALKEKAKYEALLATLKVAARKADTLSAKEQEKLAWDINNYEHKITQAESVYQSLKDRVEASKARHAGLETRKKEIAQHIAERVHERLKPFETKLAELQEDFDREDREVERITGMIVQLRGRYYGIQKELNPSLKGEQRAKLEETLRDMQEDWMLMDQVLSEHMHRRAHMEQLMRPWNKRADRWRKVRDEAIERATTRAEKERPKPVSPPEAPAGPGIEVDTTKLFEPTWELPEEIKMTPEAYAREWNTRAGKQYGIGIEHFKSIFANPEEAVSLDELAAVLRDEANMPWLDRTRAISDKQFAKYVRKMHRIITVHQLLSL